MKDLNGQSNLSELKADDWNQLPKEIENVIISTALILNSLVFTQLGRSIKEYAGASHWYNDGLFANSKVLGNELISATNTPADGQRARFRPSFANTGAVNVLISGGPLFKDLTTEAGAALTGGELTITADVEIRFDAAADEWLLIGA